MRKIWRYEKKVVPLQSDVDFLLCFRQKPGAVRVVIRDRFFVFYGIFCYFEVTKMQKNAKK